MARPAQFDADQILKAAEKVVAERGVAGATIQNIGQKLGGPTGSIYHRFKSRDVLLGEVWLRAAAAFQNGFAARLVGPDPYESGLAAVRYVSQRVREQPDEARILLLHRQEDFLADKWPRPMQSKAQLLRMQLQTGLRDFCWELLGHYDARAQRIITYALAEAPLAAVKRHVQAGEVPPPVVDEMIESTYHACLSLCGEPV